MSIEYLIENSPRKGLNEPPSDYSRFPTNPTPDLRTFLGDKSDRRKQ